MAQKTIRPADILSAVPTKDDPKKENKGQQTAGDLASYYFHQGTTTYAYEYLGAHYTEKRGKKTWTFRVWAPNAVFVELIGDFDRWGMDGSFALTRMTEQGVWECHVDVSGDINGWNGLRYKYRITGKNGTCLKADPYGIYSETCGKTASILHIPEKFEWHDRGWRTHRRNVFRSKSTDDAFYPAPLNIYEMHLGSFMTREGKTTSGDPDAYLNYREIADKLAPYLTKMGYTHVELLPVMEHPFDGSWGYQVTSYYAPTSRFGTPEDFKYFVDTLHTAGIGVILDWVPAHFPKDAHGLYEFDGQPLYEYQGKDRMEHRGWGTRCFDVGRNEVQSFLVSNALYWLREFHADGLRVDAVAAMLYLDFDKLPGEWNPNPDGSNKNLESVAFFQKLNSVVFSEFPDALMIAEESSDWPMITKRTDQGGLGFNFKWNMGWANDLFEYIATDPLYRKNCHEKLTFPLMYAFSENYILPVSHDEVVHGKKSLLDKMFGEYEDKFRGMRAFLGYMMTQPGKKMLFMGTEYGPFREWDYENQLEWFMLDYPKHADMQRYTEALNHFYLDHRELWEDDFSWGGFRWLQADDRDENVIAYTRYDRDGNPLIVCVNFSPVQRDGYCVPLTVELPAKWQQTFSSEEMRFGGSGVGNEDVIKAEPYMKDGVKEIKNRIRVTLPGLSCVIFAPVGKRKK